MKRFLAFTALVALAGTAPAAAVPVTYTLSGNFAGTLDGNGFSVAATFTGIGDTATVVDGGTYKSVTLTSLKAIAGGTTYTVGTPSVFFANVNGVAGFGDPVDGDYLDIAAAALATYDPTTSIGATPVSLDYGAIFNTDLGEIELISASDLVFSASVAALPEPAVWSLMIGGFAMTGMSVRRRRSRTEAAGHPM